MSKFVALNCNSHSFSFWAVFRGRASFVLTFTCLSPSPHLRVRIKYCPVYWLFFLWIWWFFLKIVFFMRQYLMLFRWSDRTFIMLFFLCHLKYVILGILIITLQILSFLWNQCSDCSFQLFIFWNFSLIFIDGLVSFRRGCPKIWACKFGLYVDYDRLLL
jgi:hypothetical protein